MSPAGCLPASRECVQSASGGGPGAAAPQLLSAAGLSCFSGVAVTGGRCAGAGSSSAACMPLSPSAAQACSCSLTSLLMSAGRGWLDT